MWQRAFAGRLINSVELEFLQPKAPWAPAKPHGRPKNELGAHGEEGFHAASSEYSELIIGDVRISGWRSLEK